jgi:hypothetical protein
MTITRLGPEEYLNERVDEQIEWMSKKAKGNKGSYRVLRLLQISLGIMVSAGGYYATSLDFGPQILTGLGALISLAAAWETVNDYQNNWIRYRRTKENLERERLLYRTASGPYRLSSAGGDEVEASFTLFVSRVEALLSQELDQWGTAAAQSNQSAVSQANQTENKSIDK